MGGVGQQAGGQAGRLAGGWCLGVAGGAPHHPWGREARWAFLPAFETATRILPLKTAMHLHMGKTMLRTEYSDVVTQNKLRKWVGSSRVDAQRSVVISALLHKHRHAHGQHGQSQPPRPCWHLELAAIGLAAFTSSSLGCYWWLIGAHW